MPRRRTPTKRDLSNLRGLLVGLYVRVSFDKEGDEKSTDDQRDVGLEWAERVGAVVAGVYSDPDYSASRFATKERPDFKRLLGDIEAGKLDAIWFWELSRQQRRLDVFAKLRDISRDRGVLWIIRDRVYDPTSYADMMTLGMLSVVGENESELISERTLRGKASAATAGRPASSAPYGYRRVYDPQTRRLLRQEPDVWDGNGRPIEDSPAWIVREIFDRYKTGDGTTTITRDLNHRQIPAAWGGKWAVASVLKIAKNPAYAGLRMHQGEILDGVKGTWPPLVDRETFWAVQRLLSDPHRLTWRPARARHLLSFLARCAVCDGPLVAKGSGNRAGTGVLDYVCQRGGCTGILKSALDEYVEKVVIAWLSDPEVGAELHRGGGDSEVAVHARAEAARLGIELAKLYRDAEAGDVSPVIASRSEQGLLKRIGEAEQLARDAALPPVLAANIGPQAAAGWADSTLEVKRQIIRAIADIRLRPIPREQRYARAGRGRKGAMVPVRDRVDWTPLLGPGSDR